MDRNELISGSLGIVPILFLFKLNIEYLLMSIIFLAKDIYWNLPFLPGVWKINISYWIRGKVFGSVKRRNDVFEKYVDELMATTRLNRESDVMTQTKRARGVASCNNVCFAEVA